MAQLKDPSIEWEVASQPIMGEERSGDAHLVAPFVGGVLLAALDGVGHGTEAARAAGAARSILLAHAEEPLGALARRCHEGLRATRGVVMSLAAIDAAGGMSWLGVGNVQGALLRARTGLEEELLLRPGVVGAQLPALQAARLTLAAGDTLVLATDGIDGSFSRAAAQAGTAREAAEAILRRFGRRRDDALVLVARYLGSRG